MKAFLIFFIVICCGISFADTVRQPELYSTPYWEIAGEPGKITWVEIQNGKEAQTTGIAHIMVLARKKSSPVWEVEHVCDHIAITTDALRRSVIRPFKTRGVYPERFSEAYARWKEDEKKGAAIVCSTSIQDFLKNQ